MPKIRIANYTSPRYIKQITTLEDTPAAPMLDLIHRSIIDLQDEATRQALIQLGWTPPTNTRPVKNNEK